MLDVISKRMPGEPYYASPLPRPLAQEAGADPGRLRIGVLDRPGAEGFLDDPQCRAAVASTARLLESLGHHVDQSAPAAMFEQEFIGHFNTIIAADAEAAFQAFEMLLGSSIGEDEIEPRNAEYRRSGRALDAVAYLGSRLWLGMWARRMADWWDDHDLLVTPTLGAPPPELGWFTAAGPRQERERIISFIPYTAQFNVTGQSAISLPLHSTPAGLPVGVQLAAAYGREDLLIRVASQLEHCYHGAFVPASQAESPSPDYLLCPFNAPDLLRHLFQNHGRQVATVLADQRPRPHALSPATAAFAGQIREGLMAPGTPTPRRQVTASGASVRATSAGLARPGIAGPFPLLGIYLWPRRMVAPDHNGRSPAEAGSSSWSPSSSSSDVSGPDSCLMISSA